MSLDAIVVGCSWDAVLFVGPTQGRSSADVTTDLTGATATALLYLSKDATSPVASFGASVDSAVRAISLSLGPSDTAGLEPKKNYVIDVRVRTAGGEIYPVSVGTGVEVRRLSSG